MQKAVKGHIDCPYCGASETMRIIDDKNGKPFGHCDDCNGQMRVGGNTYREKKFYSLYPWAAPEAAKIPVTVTEPKLDDKPAEAVPVAPVSVPVQTKDQPRKKASFADALQMLGGGK